MDLAKIFKSALDLRCEWHEKHDAFWTFTFPFYQVPFSEDVHYNEEHDKTKTRHIPAVASGHVGGFAHIPTNLKNRVWVATMFGIQAAYRLRAEDEYGPSKCYSKATVYMLD